MEVGGVGVFVVVEGISERVVAVKDVEGGYRGWCSAELVGVADAVMA